MAEEGSSFTTQVYSDGDGNSKVVTESHEEYHIVEEDESYSHTVSNGEVEMLRDEENFKVYRQRLDLPDGREMVTTTTIRVDENGETIEETVQEILESQEVEEDEEEDDDDIVQSDTEEQVAVQSDAEEQVAVQSDTEEQVAVQSDAEEQLTVDEEDDEDGEEEQVVVEYEHNEEQVVEGVNGGEQTGDQSEIQHKERDSESVYVDSIPDKVNNEDQQQEEDNSKTEEGETVANRISRRISYEEFQEQYTEYKPPKRYEKKQTDTAADKAAPKISIMTTTSTDSADQADTGPDSVTLTMEPGGEGLPTNSDYTSVIPTGDQLMSPHDSTGEDREDEMSQPTRTQGSVMRRPSLKGSQDARRTRSRQPESGTYPTLPGYIPDQDWMDQGATVDPANVIRADEKPDIEAELPVRGTSRSLTQKFQSLDKGDGYAPAVDYSRPSRQEKSASYSVVLEPAQVTTNGATHAEPEFEGGEIENTPEVRADVVRESDRHDTEELPEIGFARSMLTKFKSMEKESEEVKRYEHKPSGVGSKPTVTPLRPQSVIVEVDAEHIEPQVEGGEYSSEPVVRSDVIRETDRVNYEEELPSVGVTRNLVSTFKQKEVEAKSSPVYKPSGAGYRMKKEDPPRVTSRRSSSSSSEPHVEPQFEGGALENTPIVRSDVVRETDHNDENELPEPGYAKNLKLRIQQMQHQKPDYVEHRPSGVASKATPTPLGTANRSSLHSSVNSISTLSDDTAVDGRVEPQVEGGEYENQPIRREDVIREEDRTDEQELPEAGMARNLLHQFKNLESQHEPEYTPSGLGSKPTPTPLWPGPCGDVITEETELPPPEGGEYENTPIERDDVIRESDVLDTDDFPQEGVTRRQHSVYRTIAENQTEEYVPSGISQKATPSKLHIMAGRSSYHTRGTGSDIIITDNQEEPAVDAGEFENVPAVREDVVCSGISDDTDELPESGYAKNIMTRFSSMEEQNKSHISHTPSGVGNKPTPTPLRPQSAILTNTEEEPAENYSPEPFSGEVPNGGEYENTPEVNHNVIRSTDSKEHEYIPSAGAARQLLSKFKQLENKKSEQIEHRPSKVASSSTPTPLTLKR